MMTPRFRHLPGRPQSQPSPRSQGGTLTALLGSVAGSSIARVPRFAVAARPAAPVTGVAAPAAGNTATLRGILSDLVEELAGEAPETKVAPLKVVADAPPARLPGQRPPFRSAVDRPRHGVVARASRQALLAAA